MQGTVQGYSHTFPAKLKAIKPNYNGRFESATDIERNSKKKITLYFNDSSNVRKSVSKVKVRKANVTPYEEHSTEKQKKIRRDIPLPDQKMLYDKLQISDSVIQSFYPKVSKQILLHKQKSLNSKETYKEFPNIEYTTNNNNKDSWHLNEDDLKKQSSGTAGKLFENNNSNNVDRVPFTATGAKITAKKANWHSNRTIEDKHNDMAYSHLNTSSNLNKNTAELKSNNNHVHGKPMKVSQHQTGSQQNREKYSWHNLQKSSVLGRFEVSTNRNLNGFKNKETQTRVNTSDKANAHNYKTSKPYNNPKHSIKIDNNTSSINAYGIKKVDFIKIAYSKHSKNTKKLHRPTTDKPRLSKATSLAWNNITGKISTIKANNPVESVDIANKSENERSYNLTTSRPTKINGKVGKMLRRYASGYSIAPSNKITNTSTFFIGSRKNRIKTSKNKKNIASNSRNITNNSINITSGFPIGRKNQTKKTRTITGNIAKTMNTSSLYSDNSTLHLNTSQLYDEFAVHEEKKRVLDLSSAITRPIYETTKNVAATVKSDDPYTKVGETLQSTKNRKVYPDIDVLKNEIVSLESSLPLMDVRNLASNAGQNSVETGNENLENQNNDMTNCRKNIILKSNHSSENRRQLISRAMCGEKDSKGDSIDHVLSEAVSTMTHHESNAIDHILSGQSEAMNNGGPSGNKNDVHMDSLPNHMDSLPNHMDPLPNHMDTLHTHSPFGPTGDFTYDGTEGHDSVPIVQNMLTGSSSHDTYGHTPLLGSNLEQAHTMGTHFNTYDHNSDIPATGLYFPDEKLNGIDWHNTYHKQSPPKGNTANSERDIEELSDPYFHPGVGKPMSKLNSHNMGYHDNDHYEGQGNHEIAVPSLMGLGHGNAGLMGLDLDSVHRYLESDQQLGVLYNEKPDIDTHQAPLNQAGNIGNMEVIHEMRNEGDTQFTNGIPQEINHEIRLGTSTSHLLGQIAGAAAGAAAGSLSSNIKGKLKQHMAKCKGRQAGEIAGAVIGCAVGGISGSHAGKIAGGDAGEVAGAAAGYSLPASEVNVVGGNINGFTGGGAASVGDGPIAVKVEKGGSGGNSAGKAVGPVAAAALVGGMPGEIAGQAAGKVAGAMIAAGEAGKAAGNAAGVAAGVAAGKTSGRVAGHTVGEVVGGQHGILTGFNTAGKGREGLEYTKVAIGGGITGGRTREAKGTTTAEGRSSSAGMGVMGDQGGDRDRNAVTVGKQGGKGAKVAKGGAAERNNSRRRGSRRGKGGKGGHKRGKYSDAVQFLQIMDSREGRGNAERLISTQSLGSNLEGSGVIESIEGKNGGSGDNSEEGEVIGGNVANIAAANSKAVGQESGRVAGGTAGKAVGPAAGGMITGTDGKAIGKVAGGAMGVTIGQKAGGVAGKQVGGNVGDAVGGAAGQNGLLSSERAGTVIGTTGEVLGGLQGRLRGKEAGATAGQAAGQESGAIAGETAGEAAGKAAGEVVAGEAGGEIGKEAGGIAGVKAGKTAGSIAGQQAGESVGGEVGGVTGAKVGQVVGGKTGQTEPGEEEGQDANGIENNNGETGGGGSGNSIGEGTAGGEGSTQTEGGSSSGESGTAGNDGQSGNKGSNAEKGGLNGGKGANEVEGNSGSGGLVDKGSGASNRVGGGGNGGNVGKSKGGSNGETGENVGQSGANSVQGGSGAGTGSKGGSGNKDKGIVISLGGLGVGGNGPKGRNRTKGATGNGNTGGGLARNLSGVGNIAGMATGHLFGGTGSVAGTSDQILGGRLHGGLANGALDGGTARLHGGLENGVLGGGTFGLHGGLTNGELGGGTGGLHGGLANGALGGGTVGLHGGLVNGVLEGGTIGLHGGLANGALGGGTVGQHGGLTNGALVGGTVGLHGGLANGALGGGTVRLHEGLTLGGRTAEEIAAAAHAAGVAAGIEVAKAVTGHSLNGVLPGHTSHGIGLLHVGGQSGTNGGNGSGVNGETGSNTGGQGTSGGGQSGTNGGNGSGVNGETGSNTGGQGTSGGGKGSTGTGGSSGGDGTKGGKGGQNGDRGGNGGKGGGNGSNGAKGMGMENSSRQLVDNAIGIGTAVGGQIAGENRANEVTGNGNAGNHVDVNVATEGHTGGIPIGEVLTTEAVTGTNGHILGGQQGVLHGNEAGGSTGQIVGQESGRIAGGISGEVAGQVAGGIIAGKAGEAIGKAAGGAAGVTAGQTAGGIAGKQVEQHSAQGVATAGNTLGGIHGGLANGALGVGTTTLHGGLVNGALGGGITGLHGGLGNGGLVGGTSMIHGGLVNGGLGGAVAGLHGGLTNGALAGEITGLHGGLANGALLGGTTGIHGGIEHGALAGGITGLHGGLANGALLGGIENGALGGRIVGIHGGIENGALGGRIAGLHSGLANGALVGVINGIHGGLENGELVGGTAGIHGGLTNGVLVREAAGLHGGLTNGALGGGVTGLHGGLVNGALGGGVAGIHGVLVNGELGGGITGLHGGLPSETQAVHVYGIPERIETGNTLHGHTSIVGHAEVFDPVLDGIIGGSNGRIISKRVGGMEGQETGILPGGAAREAISGGISGQTVAGILGGHTRGLSQGLGETEGGSHGREFVGNIIERISGPKAPEITSNTAGGMAEHGAGVVEDMTSGGIYEPTSGLRTADTVERVATPETGRILGASAGVSAGRISGETSDQIASGLVGGIAGQSRGITVDVSNGALPGGKAENIAHEAQSAGISAGIESGRDVVGHSVNEAIGGVGKVGLLHGQTVGGIVDGHAGVSKQVLGGIADSAPGRIVGNSIGGMAGNVVDGVVDGNGGTPVGIRAANNLIEHPVNEFIGGVEKLGMLPEHTVTNLVDSHAGASERVLGGMTDGVSGGIVGNSIGGMIGHVVDDANVRTHEGVRAGGITDGVSGGIVGNSIGGMTGHVVDYANVGTHEGIRAGGITDGVSGGIVSNSIGGMTGHVVEDANVRTHEGISAGNTLIGHLENGVIGGVGKVGLLPGHTVTRIVDGHAVVPEQVLSGITDGVSGGIVGNSVEGMTSHVADDANVRTHEGISAGNTLIGHSENGFIGGVGKFGLLPGHTVTGMADGHAGAPEQVLGGITDGVSGGIVSNSNGGMTGHVVDYANVGTHEGIRPGNTFIGHSENGVIGGMGKFRSLPGHILTGIVDGHEGASEQVLGGITGGVSDEFVGGSIGGLSGQTVGHVVSGTVGGIRDQESDVLAGGTTGREIGGVISDTGERIYGETTGNVAGGAIGGIDNNVIDGIEDVVGETHTDIGAGNTLVGHSVNRVIGGAEGVGSLPAYTTTGIVGGHRGGLGHRLIGIRDSTDGGDIVGNRIEGIAGQTVGQITGGTVGRIAGQESGILEGDPAAGIYRPAVDLGKLLNTAGHGFGRILSASSGDISVPAIGQITGGTVRRMDGQEIDGITGAAEDGLCRPEGCINGGIVFGTDGDTGGIKGVHVGEPCRPIGCTHGGIVFGKFVRGGSRKTAVQEGKNARKPKHISKDKTGKNDILTLPTKSKDVLKLNSTVINTNISRINDTDKKINKSDSSFLRVLGNDKTLEEQDDVYATLKSTVDFSNHAKGIELLHIEKGRQNAENRKNNTISEQKAAPKETAKISSRKVVNIANNVFLDVYPENFTVNIDRDSYKKSIKDILFMAGRRGNAERSNITRSMEKYKKVSPEGNISLAYPSSSSTRISEGDSPIVYPNSKAAYKIKDQVLIGMFYKKRKPSFYFVNGSNVSEENIDDYNISKSTNLARQTRLEMNNPSHVNNTSEESTSKNNIPVNNKNLFNDSHNRVHIKKLHTIKKALKNKKNNKKKKSKSQLKHRSGEDISYVRVLK